MPRRKPPPDTPPDTPPATPPPVILHPTAVYTVPQLRAALGLTASTVRHEVRAGRLRVARRAGRYWMLGAWVLEWIEGGELSRSSRPGRNGVSPPPRPEGG